MKSVHFHWDNVYRGFGQMSLLKLIRLSKISTCAIKWNSSCVFHSLKQVLEDGLQKVVMWSWRLQLSQFSLPLSLLLEKMIQTPCTFKRNLLNIIPCKTITQRSKFWSSLRSDYVAGTVTLSLHKMRELGQHASHWLETTWYAMWAADDDRTMKDKDILLFTLASTTTLQ